MLAKDRVFPLQMDTMRNEGLTARDYIAIKAMQGLASDPTFSGSSDDYYKAVANWSYKLADAMIEQSNK